MRTRSLLSLLVICLTALVLSSCSSTPPEPEKVYTPYQQFILNTTAYPTTMAYYVDEELLKQHTAKCPIFVSLKQQRARMYVNGQVAMDWPVSTGVGGHETPTGKFRIVEKEKEHSSNRYGHLYDADGKCINSNADIFVDEMPEGGKFVGSPMPNWMRLTADGVGMHTGKVKAGKRLSHGCIRTPHVMAVKLFELTTVGTPTTIVAGVEEMYPGHEAIAERAQKDIEEEQARKLAEQKAAERKAKEEARKNRKSWLF